MERLTKVFEENNQKYVCIDVCGKKCVEGYSVCHDCKPFTDVMKKLADYEDAEEQGLLAKVVHGEWIIEKSDTCYWYGCSECGEHVPLNNYKREWYSDYCPNCGAKMDGKEEGVKNE